MPKEVRVTASARVDLTAASITGDAGYVFRIATNGANLTVVGGQINGPIAGLIEDALPEGSSAAVTITGTVLQGARSIVYAPKAGGPISIRVDQVNATGLGDGIRATADAIDVTSSILTGGGAPPLSSEPAGIHSLDDTAGNVAVPASHINVYDSILTGFTSVGLQGDSIIGETRVATADIQRNTLGHNSDSGALDSKIGSALVAHNTIYSDGDRAISSHYGTLTSTGNTIYQAATSPAGDPGKAYQASGNLNASNDIVALTPGAYLAQAVAVMQPGSGPESTYPRVGQITLTGITDPAGQPLLGPIKVKPNGAGPSPQVQMNSP